jgi:hypothetical protein
MDFEERINNAIKELFKIGYKPRIFMDMRIEYGTIDAIKHLIHSDKASSGFTTLWKKQQLDLSVENIIQEPEWANIFTEDDRFKAIKRLKEYNFANNKE